MKKIKEPDKDVLVYIVFEMKKSEVGGIIQQVKDSKKLKFKYYWLDQDWRQDEKVQN